MPPCLLPKRRPLNLLPALALLLATTQPTQAKTPRIALTFDDLPAMTLIKDEANVEALNRKLLAGLKRHHIPATGFVNEGKLDELDRARQIAVLRQWVAAGMNLGNHSFSHETPETIGEQAYVADIAAGEVVTKKLLAEAHKTIRYYRHPYLETGSPLSVKRAIETWLTAHHYRIAPVTLNATDWLFAEPYEDALTHGDLAAAAKIKTRYLAYTAKMFIWYRKAAHALFGRDIAYVMLLHATKLNADNIDDLAALIKQAKFKPVSLDKAMRDPAYKTPDPYAAKDGVDWMERWSMELKKQLPWDDYAEPPTDIAKEYERLDKD